MKNIVFALLVVVFTGCSTATLQAPATTPKHSPVSLEETKAAEMMAKVPEGQWAIAPSFRANPIVFLTERGVITERRWGGPR